ncbi:MAG: SusC/RagA family TonB-linked outer membrane protein [Prolixibacteraceae bacterium]
MKFKITTGIILLLLISLSGTLFGQAPSPYIIVQGSVKDPNNETLVGVSVIEVDSKNRYMSATITDYNGQYVLKVRNPQNKIVYSFIGFKTQQQEVGSRRKIDVVLKEEMQEIADVIVKAERVHNDGNFKIPEREISTAVQTIDAKAFEGVQVTSLDDALQGRIAGFDIVSNSGDLGSGTTMRIRGTTSINASSEPLIVVNGIPYEVQIDPTFDFANASQEQFANMLSINPDDIEDITVLKDAASTAIWGSKGANGVLVIKTKRGVKGPTRVQYSYRLTRAVQPEGLKMLNGDEYTMMMKQAYFNPTQNENAANVREFLYDQQFPEYENFNNNTDWVKAVSQTAFKHDHYLTVSGGGERASFRVSGGILKETGTVIGQSLDRFSSRAYLDYAISDRIRFISEISFTYTDNDQNWRLGNGAPWMDKLSLLDIAYRKMPNMSIYAQDLEGNDTDVYYNIDRTSSLGSDQRDLRNPIALANLATNNIKNYRILPTFRLNYDLTDPEEQILRYAMYITFDVNNNKNSMYLPREVSNVDWNNQSANLASSNDSENLTVMADNNLTWQSKFSNADHNLLLYGSYQLRMGNYSTQGITTANLPSGEIVDASAVGYLSDLSTGRSAYRSNALLARAHYSYKSRYIVSATFRRDGSTKFGADRKYGNFPGISAKWIISDEEWMMSTKRWLSMLAIRPSWGISGNQPDQEYLHFSRYSPYGSYLGQTATRPTTLQLSDLKWETTTSMNYGLDLGFWDDRIQMELNIYNKRTEDLLFKNLGLPTSSGYAGIAWQNVGIMDNNGWEFNFHTNNVVKAKDVTVDFNFNLSNYVNTIVEMDANVLANYNGEYDYSNGTYLSRLQEGNSYGSIYGFRYKGVYQYNEYVPGDQENAPVARDANGKVFTDEDGEPLPMYFAYGKSNAYEFQGGDAIYEDINKDGSIDELDIVYLGNSNPKVNGGFGSTLRYKNFACTIFFNFRYGNKIVNIARMNAENMYTVNNQSKSVNWRWRKDGDVTNMPRALYNYGYNWLGSDRYVEDGSFTRLKHVTLNYRAPSKKLQKYNIQSLNFYLTMNNLFVWTNYSGVDPEVGYGSFSVSKDEANTPRSKDITLGISLTF